MKFQEALMKTAVAVDAGRVFYQPQSQIDARERFEEEARERLIRMRVQQIAINRQFASLKSRFPHLGFLKE